MTVGEYLANQAARLREVPRSKEGLLAQARAESHDFLIRKVVPDPDRILPRSNFRGRQSNPYHEQLQVGEKPEWAAQ